MASYFSRTKLSSFLLFSVLFLMSSSEAREYLVGGKSDGWKTPSSEADSLNHWSENSRFLIGDSLVFEYEGSKDSVLLVTQKNYVACNTSSPIERYSGGNTTVKLERSGPYYFISGADGHCVNGQKVIVVVISERHGRFTGISPAPSQESLTPAPAPASGAGRLFGGAVLSFVAAAVGLAVM